MKEEDKFDSWLERGNIESQEAPQGYFENLDDQVINKWMEDSDNVKPLRWNKWIGAVAASLLILGSVWFLSQKSPDVTTMALAQEWELEELLDDLGDDDLDELLTEMEDEYYQIDESMEDLYYDEAY